MTTKRFTPAPRGSSGQVLHVVGARPNFMKAAPVLRALSADGNLRQTLVHTGQHYDFNMSEVFFEQLQMRSPDYNLGVGSGTHAEQTAQIMLRFEPVLQELRPDMVVVYGDVNSTIACALVSAKLGVPVAHVEAGLRSFDRTMPEEINRILTDRLADFLFTPSADGDDNLIEEGVDREKIYRVGNVMIDSLVRLLPAARQHVPNGIPERFVLVTMHRPANVDDPEMMAELITTFRAISQEIPVIFPVHPRTRSRIAALGSVDTGDVRLLDPLPYMEFLGLQERATAVVTDSGGVQEETTYLNIPCLTFRENTERPITVSMGTNTLIERDTKRLAAELHNVLAGSGKQGRVPPLWDGHASDRIAEIIMTVTGGRRAVAA